jgi:hypothetical protein
MRSFLVHNMPAYDHEATSRGTGLHTPRFCVVLPRRQVALIRPNEV